MPSSFQSDYLEAMPVSQALLGELTMARGAKSEMVEASIERLPREFRYADVAAACPGVSRPTIRRVLDKLRQQGLAECTKAGRDATWRKL